jgi:hypothetical protein
VPCGNRESGAALAPDEMHHVAAPVGGLLLGRVAEVPRGEGSRSSAHIDREPRPPAAGRPTEPATALVAAQCGEVRDGGGVLVREQRQVCASRREPDEAWLLHAYSGSAVGADNIARLSRMQQSAGRAADPRRSSARGAVLAGRQLTAASPSAEKQRFRPVTVLRFPGAGAAVARRRPRFPQCGRLVAVVVSVVFVEGEQARLGHVLRHLGAHVGGGDARGAEVDAAPHARVLDLLDR